MGVILPSCQNFSLAQQFNFSVDYWFNIINHKSLIITSTALKTTLRIPSHLRKHKSSQKLQNKNNYATLLVWEYIYTHTHTEPWKTRQNRKQENTYRYKYNTTGMAGRQEWKNQYILLQRLILLHLNQQRNITPNNYSVVFKNCPLNSHLVWISTSESIVNNTF